MKSLNDFPVIQCKMRSNHFLKIFLFGAFIWSACGEATGPQAIDSTIQSEILGIWELDAAYRNGSSTESLRGAHFTFEQPNLFSTNVFGSEVMQEVIWKDSIFMPLDSSMTYKVESLEKDTLKLTFDVQRYAFDLICHRSASNESKVESPPAQD